MESWDCEEPSYSQGLADTCWSPALTEFGVLGEIGVENPIDVRESPVVMPLLLLFSLCVVEPLE